MEAGDELELIHFLVIHYFMFIYFYYFIIVSLSLNVFPHEILNI